MIHHQNEIWWAFCEYYRNGDGIITAEETRSILRDDDVATFQECFREYDRDCDGRINYEEWVRMVVPPVAATQPPRQQEVEMGIRFLCRQAPWRAQA